MVAGGVSAPLVSVEGVTVVDVVGADVVVEAGAEVVVVDVPVSPVVRPAIVVFEMSPVCCARTTGCEGGSDGAELEATAPPTTPPTKPAPTSAANARLMRFLMVRSCV